MTGPGSTLETRAEGAPGEVAAAADWLRDSLATALEAAGDDLLAARAIALDSFRGRAGAAYVALDERLVRLLDEHAERVGAAARLVDAWAARLGVHHARMASVRARARAGDLTVHGTLVSVPAPALALGLGRPDPLGLFVELQREVLAERAALAAWVGEHLAGAAEELEVTGLERWAGRLRRHLDGVGREFARDYAAHTLAEAARVLEEKARDLETAHRSGDPAHRALDLDPATVGRAGDLRDLSRWADAGGRLIGPAGTAVDSYTALESDKPGGELLGVGAGAAAGTLGFGFAAAFGAPAIGAVGAGAVGGYAVGATVTYVWERFPDEYTDPVDDLVDAGWEGVKDGAHGAKDAARGTWKAVTGWVR